METVLGIVLVAVGLAVILFWWVPVLRWFNRVLRGDRHRGPS